MRLAERVGVCICPNTLVLYLENFHHSAGQECKGFAFARFKDRKSVKATVKPTATVRLHVWMAKVY